MEQVFHYRRLQQRYNLRDFADRTSYVIWFSSVVRFVRFIDYLISQVGLHMTRHAPSTHLPFVHTLEVCNRTQTHSFQDNDHQNGPNKAQIHVHSSTCHQKGAALKSVKGWNILGEFKVIWSIRCVLGVTSLNRSCTDSFFKKSLLNTCIHKPSSSLTTAQRFLLHKVTKHTTSNVTCTFPQHQTLKHQCIPPHYVKQLLLMPHERLKLSITQHYPPEGSNQCINAFKNALYTDLEEIRNPLKFQSMWEKFNWKIIKWFVRFSSIPNPIMYKCNEINFCNFAFTGFCMTSATPVMMHCEMHRSVSCSMQFSLGHRGRDANIWEAFQLLRIQNGFSCNQQHSIFFSIFLSMKENIFL